MDNPIWTAFGVPLIFLLCGALGKKLVRGAAKGWERTDFYLGAQMTLSVLSADLLYISEVARRHILSPQPVGAAEHNRELTGVVFCVVVIAIYLILLSLHQDWEPKVEDRRGQILRLVVASNVFGISLFAIFVFLIKGVS